MTESAFMWTLPNLISLFRIALVPFLVYLLTGTDRLSSAFAAALFLVASATDYLDGYLARRRGMVSDLGKVLDPLADKLMIVAALIMLAAMQRPGGDVPAWLVVVIVGRETAVTILRGIALTEGIIIEAEELGKYKFVMQVFAVAALVLHYSYLGLDFYVVGMYFLMVSTVVGLWSAVNYHLKFFHLIRQKSATNNS